MEATYSEVEFKLGCCLQMGNAGTFWRVVDIDEESKTAVVIANKEICYKAYNDRRVDIAWENCTLRKWLNSEYYENTFSNIEKAAIIESDIHTPDNPKYNTKGGNDTKDRIWLLSLDEAGKYFKDDDDRETGSWWWLRSPGHNSGNAAFVNFVGSVYSVGDGVYYSCDAVRPAFKINLESEFFKSLISTNQNGETIINNPEMITKAGIVTYVNKNITDAHLPVYVKEIPSYAFTDCKNLKSITWENPKLKLYSDSFIRCPKLRLPVGLYITEKEVDNAFAKYIPDSIEAAAYVLTYQKDTLLWLKYVMERLEADKIPELIAKMRELSPNVPDPTFYSLADRMRKCIPRVG